MSIKSLMDDWRENWLDVNGASCADELEAAMPVWTKITNDPDTWPKYGLEVMFYGNPMGEPKRYLGYFAADDQTFSYLKGAYWRPLCDLDHPPEDIK